MCREARRGVFYSADRLHKNGRACRGTSGKLKEEGPTEVMDNEISTQPHGMEDVEIQEWLESLDAVLESSGPEVAAEILERLRAHATVNGIDLPFSANTPYANTIPARLQPLFPGH